MFLATIGMREIALKQTSSFFILGELHTKICPNLHSDCDSRPKLSDFQNCQRGLGGMHSSDYKFTVMTTRDTFNVTVNRFVSCWPVSSCKLILIWTPMWFVCTFKILQGNHHSWRATPERLVGPRES